MRTAILALVALSTLVVGLIGRPVIAAGQPEPLNGKDVTKASQLVGRWVRTSETGDFEVLEFLKDGKEMIAGDADGGVKLGFSVLEGGRLALEAPGGMTTIFKAVTSGDQLELRGDGNAIIGGGTQRYRKLKSGESAADALRAIAQAKAKAYQERAAAVEAFLKQPKLVLAFGDGPGAPPSIALDIQAAGGGFTGKAWHDDKPPRQNAISGSLALDQAAQTTRINVVFGNRIAPPATQPDGGGQITLDAVGEGKNLRISSKVSYGSGPAHDVVLRPDPKLHDQIVKRFEAELARIEAVRQPMIGLLKDHAVLRGRLASADARRLVPDTAEVVLVRDAASGHYAAEGYIMNGQRGRGEMLGRGAAAIAVVSDRPVLRVVFPPTREFLLSITSGSTPGLEGQHQFPGGQGLSAKFEVESLDAAARDAKFAAQSSALRSLGQEAAFIGLAHEESGSGMDMPIPVRLRLSVNADGSVTGKAEYPSLATVMTVAGSVADTLAGPRLQLSYPSVETTPGDQIFLRSIQRGVWTLAPADGGGPMKLSGHFAGQGLRGTVLTAAGDEQLSQLRGRVAAALREPTQLFVSRFVGWQQMNGWPAHATPTVVEWRVDEAAGTVSGRTIVDGRALGTNEKTSPVQEGTLKVENGWLVMDVWQTMRWGTSKQLAAIRLFPCEDAAGNLHLNGAMISLAHIPDAAPTPEFPSKFERRVELVPVSQTDPETRSAVARAIEKVEQARAEASAAQEAQAQAATDARRTQLTPFFPMFKGTDGLALTTDAPAEMGSIILEAAVDEAAATITGSGIDLREMPFREFTFECAADARGNLVITTSLSKTPQAVAPPAGPVAKGRGVTLAQLSPDERAKVDSRISLGRRLGGASPATLPVEVLDAATAKAREAGLGAAAMPGVAIFRGVANDRVAPMFTPQARAGYRWAKEPVSLRLNEPMQGKAIYFKSSGPTTDLTVIINGVHRATVGAVAQNGAAIIQIPADLEVLDLRLETAGTAQSRGVVLIQ